MIRNATTASEALAAYIEGNFSEEVFKVELTFTWLTFWARARHSPTLQASHDAMAKRTIAGLARALGSRLSKEAARREALAFTVFVDGLWLRAALNPDQWSPAQARQMCYRYLHRQLGLKVGPADAERLKELSQRQRREAEKAAAPLPRRPRGRPKGSKNKIAARSEPVA